MTTKTVDLYNEIQKRVEGRIACVCGNADWKMFLYIQSGKLIAGCKLCGQVQEVDDQEA